MSAFVATTIGRGGMVAILEVQETEKPQKGEVKLSKDCVRFNLQSGLFTDMTDKVSNADGKVYILTSDLEAN